MMSCPHIAADFRAQIESLDHLAVAANRRGDRCGWVLLCALAAHLRDYCWDSLPWLRDDACRQPVPGAIVHTRGGRRIPAGNTGP